MGLELQLLGAAVSCGLAAALSYGFSFNCRVMSSCFNPLRPNIDLNQTSHCNIKGLSVSEVMRIENMITKVKFY